MFERFTDRARRVVVLAQGEQRRSGSPEIETDHILVGLILEKESLAAQVLDRLGVHLDAVRRPAVDVPHADGSAQFSDRTKKVFEFALREALQLGHNYIAPEHLLLAIVREGEGLAAKSLTGVDVRREVIATISGARRSEDVRSYVERLRDRAKEFGTRNDQAVGDALQALGDALLAVLEPAASRWFVDTFARWSFLLDETRGIAMTIGGDFAHRTKMIADLVGSDQVAVDVSGQGLALAEMLTDAGADVVRVTRTAQNGER